MTTTRDLVEAHPFLAGWDASARQRLVALGHRIQFLTGATVFGEGGLPDRFWSIVDGHVQLGLHLSRKREP